MSSPGLFSACERAVAERTSLALSPMIVVSLLLMCVVEVLLGTFAQGCRSCTRGAMVSPQGIFHRLSPGVFQRTAHGIPQAHIMGVSMAPPTGVSLGYAMAHHSMPYTVSNGIFSGLFHTSASSIPRWISRGMHHRYQFPVMCC
jgi:hypothetical protein